MKEAQMMAISAVAVVLSIIAIGSAVILKPTATIGAGAVGSNELADNSVTGAKVADGTITDADIVSGGISRIADGAITLAKLAADAIVSLENIADNSITSINIQDGTITDADISSTAAIDPSKLATYPFGLDDLATDSVNSAKVVDNSITSADIQDGTIQTEDIAENALTQTAENFADAVAITTQEEPNYENLDSARIDITTDNSPVLILFSGVFSNNIAGRRVRVGLVIDGNLYITATRTGTSVGASDPFVLAFNCMPTLSAGPHTIQVIWWVDIGQGTAYNRTLDIVELKR